MSEPRGAPARVVEAERDLLVHVLYLQASPALSFRVEPEQISPNHGRFRGPWAAARSAEAKGETWSTVDVVSGDDLDYLDRAASARVAMSDARIAGSQQTILEHASVQAAVARLDRVRAEARTGDLGHADMLRELHEITGDLEAFGAKGAVHWTDAAREWALEWGREFKDRKAVPMPLPRMQAAYGGWRQGRLHFISAPTSTHKTTLARMAAVHAADAGYPSVYWTLEDDNSAIVSRTMAAEVPLFTTDHAAHVGIERLTEGELATTMREIGEQQEKDRPLWLLDRPATSADISGQLRAMKAKYGIRLAVIDYFQLIRPDGRDEGHVDRCAQAMHDLAKTLGIALIICVQPTQEATKKHSQGGTLDTGDLRGGSSIGQAAFAVLTLNRVREDIKLDRPGGRVVTIPKGAIRLIVRKWKGGKRGQWPLTARGEHDMLYELAIDDEHEARK